MKNWAAALCCTVLVCGALHKAQAQWLEKPLCDCVRPLNVPHTQARASAPAKRPIDILHYALSLRLTMRDGRLQGVNRIHICSWVNELPRISLSAAALVIDSVQLPTGERLSFQHQGDSLHVILPVPAQQGDTMTLMVHYHTNAGRRGYYFYTAQESGSEPIAYTMSQPYDARYWMPCLDEPDDKATAEISITVPRGFIAASIGRLTHVEQQGEETTYHWATQCPVATYLMCVTVSRYVVLRETYRRARQGETPDGRAVASLQDTLPIEHYVWREDSLNAVGFFQNLRRMIEVCETTFGIPYPFEKYGQAAVRPFRYGGMEHQTLSTLNRNLLWNENLIVHELAHQWWGDMVTCESWRDLWLNEGFATYTEALWQEYLNGKEGLRRYMRARIRPHLWQTSIYNPSPLFGDVVYGKAAWVLQMLRGLMGDERFRALLKQYGERHKFGNANTAAFQQIAEEIYGGKLDWFFQQWIFGTGIPKLEYAWQKRQEASGWRVTVRIRQTQAEPVFKLPMELQLYAADGKAVFKRTMESRDTTFVLHAASEPQMLVLDEDEWILKDATNLTDLLEQSQTGRRFKLEQNYPNPFNPTTTIRYELPSFAFVQLRVYDMLGREVATLVNARQAAGRYEVVFDATGLPSGMYVYRLVAGNWQESKKMMLVK
ncbi:MAG: M1 family aminopeptidase [Chloroherpetonaceae bacterium]|nr:M1 family aminopeptidase [Chloroherpetonaceae bacterium]